MEDHVIPYLIPIRRFSESTGDGTIKWIDGNKLWIQLYPYDSWDHPIYGTTTVDKDKAQKFADNFARKVYGQDVHTDYEHGFDPAKGKKASGKILEVKPGDNGVRGLVQFTEEAVKEIEAGEWNYWSTEHFETWTHPQTKEKVHYLITGGGLTNKPWVKGMTPLNFSEIITEPGAAEQAMRVINEHSDLETHEPGGGVVDPKTNEDDAAESGSRRDTPPAGEDGTVPDRSQTVKNEGGETVEDSELLKKLREALNLDENADIVKCVTEMNDEVGPLREVARQHAERRRFSEDFPEEFKEMQELKKSNRENFARQFSESLVDRRVKEKDGDKEVDTTIGLSGLAIEKAREVALKFSEGTVNFDDFKQFTDAIYSNGLVDYGTKGSSTTDDDPKLDEDDPRRFSEVPATRTDSRRLFAEAVLHYQNEVQEKDKLEGTAAYARAIEVAAEKHPELYEAYMSPAEVK